MKMIGLAAGLAVALVSSSSYASVLFNNPYAMGSGGNCAFSTTCAAQYSLGDDYAAQAFTITQDVVVTGAAFLELDKGTTPTDVNWGILQNDGAGGLPGTILAAGTDTLSAQAVGNDGSFNLTEMSWTGDSVYLTPGTYYLALQAISPVYQTYLGQGVATSGAAETQDSGATWAPNYEYRPSVAVSVYGDLVGVPEPATWALMIVGLLATGALLRRRRPLVAAV